MKTFLLFIFIVTSIYKGNSQNISTIETAFELLAKFSNIRDFTMSSSENEGYFTIQSPSEEVSVIAKINKENNVWIEPIITSFSGKFKDLEPFLSPDNLRLYFASDRPLNDSINKTKDFDIWYVERKALDAKWGIPINVGAPVNTDYDEFYPSIAKNNNLYFTCDGSISKGKDDIFLSEWDNNHYLKPISLSETINTSGFEFNAYVSPDESFIIYSGYQREDGVGSGDLYISYRDENKQWSAAVNLGPEINSKYMDYSPYFDLKSNSLYFTSRRSDFKRINNFHNIEELTNEINKYENGMSRIYKISLRIK